MATPESKVKKKVKALLADYDNIYVNMPVPGGYGTPMLDFVCCLNGRFFMIETKAEGEELTPRQAFIKSEVEAAGGRVFVITGLNEDNNPDSWQGWKDLVTYLDWYTGKHWGQDDP